MAEGGQAWLFEELTAMRREIQEQHQRLRGDINAVADRLAMRLESIDDQVKLTNGRVTRSEKDILIIQTQRSMIIALAAALGAAAMAIVGWSISWFK